MSSTRAAALALIAVFGSAGCDVRVSEEGVSLDVGAGKASDEWVRSYTLPQDGTLEIAAVDGPITVTAASGSAIEVRAHREARAASDQAAQDALRAVAIDEQAGSDRVRIATRTEGRGGRRRVTVAYTVQMPPGLRASFTTRNGAIHLDNVSGTITASAANGGVNGTGLSGRLSASVVNGGLQLDVRSVTEPVELSAVNGGIRLTLSRDTRATLAASALNGGVTVDQAFGLTKAAQSGSFVGAQAEGSINGGGPLITAKATNGGVRIIAR
jgi:hypothetical protein